MTRYTTTMRDLLAQVRAKEESLVKSLTEAKTVKREEDEPASPDESGMAADQLKFIKYAAEEIMQHIQNGGEFPEWMQNKLSGTHEKMKTLHANINHDNVESVKEEVELDEMKQPFVVIDTADGNKVVAMASDEKGAKSSIASAELPPMKIKDKKTLKIVKTRKKQDIGYPLKEGTWAMADTPKDVAALKKIMSKPLPLGKEGDDAADAIYNLLGDDELLDMLYVDGKKNEKGDARKTIIKWFQNRVKKNDYGLGPKTKELGKQIGLKMEYVPEGTELEEGKSSTGYELYHKDFSSAMAHAYDFAKKKFGIEVDPKEIDDKVASGPRKPSSGKTNTYRLKGKGGKGAIHVQVYNMDNKKYELNMYKESVDLEEKLKVSDGLGAWIDDFKKSDAPQFKGKSDEEKKNMAIAAFTDAGGKLESVEEALDPKKVVDYLVKKGNNPKDAQKMVDKQFAYVTKTYKNVSVAKAAEIISSLKEETLEELAMPRKDFEKLKKGDKVTITYDSSIRRGTTNTFTVTGRSKSAKYNVDKVSMTIDGKGKYYLYSRKGGDATLALGDMGASMTKIVMEEGEAPANDQAKKVDQGKEDQKKTRIAQLQLQIAKAQEMINKINRASEIEKMRKGE